MMQLWYHVAMYWCLLCRSLDLVLCTLATLISPLQFLQMKVVNNMISLSAINFEVSWLIWLPKLTKTLQYKIELIDKTTFYTFIINN